MKKFGGILCAAFALMFTVSASAQSINLKIDGVIQNLELDSVIEEDILLTDVVKLSKALGAAMKYSDNSNTVTVSKDGRTIILSVGKTQVDVNGQKLNAPIAPKKVNQQIYVPARFVSERLNAQVSWIAKSSTIVITTNKKSAGILDLKETATPDAKVLTYKSWLSYARDASSQLKNLDESKKLLEESLDKAEEAESQALNANNKQGETSALRQQFQLNNDLKSLDDNKKIIEASIEYSYRNYFTNIITLLIDRQTLLENIELAKVNVKNVTLKHQLGMESDFNLNQAKESLKTYQSQLSNIEISIRNAKEVLNQYLGFSVKNDIFIEYDLKYAKIPDNVTTHISTRTGGEDPKLKIEWRSVEYYRYVEETYDPEAEESKIKIDNDVLTAERKYNDLVISYEKAIREKYNQLKQLEERRLQLEIDFNLAKETYNKAVVNFEAGMITLYDTLNAKLNYLKLEGDLLKNQIDYDNLKFAYERPYLG